MADTLNKRLGEPCQNSILTIITTDVVKLRCNFSNNSTISSINLLRCVYGRNELKLSAEPMSDNIRPNEQRRNKAIRCGLSYSFPLMNERNTNATKSAKYG